jgi:hypothetical protein
VQVAQVVSHGVQTVLAVDEQALASNVPAAQVEHGAQTVSEVPPQALV